MYVCIVVFMVLNSNLRIPIPDTLSFTRFGVDTASPLAQKTPNSQIVPNDSFILEFFIYSLYFLKPCQDVDTIFLNMKLVLLTMAKLDRVPWGLLRVKTTPLGTFLMLSKIPLFMRLSGVL